MAMSAASIACSRFGEDAAPTDAGTSSGQPGSLDGATAPDGRPPTTPPPGCPKSVFLETFAVLPLTQWELKGSSEGRSKWRACG